MEFTETLSIEFRHQYSKDSRWSKWKSLPYYVTLEDFVSIKFNPGFYGYQFKYGDKLYAKINNELMEIFKKELFWQKLNR